MLHPNHPHKGSAARAPADASRTPWRPPVAPRTSVPVPNTATAAPSTLVSSWRTQLAQTSQSSEPTQQRSNNGALAPLDNGAKSSSLRQLVVDGVQDGQEVQVKFCLKYRTSYGQSVKIVGSHPKLGAWDMNKALDLKWTEGDRWMATMDLPAGSVYEYKYVLIDHGTNTALAWQGGGNSVLALQDEDSEVEVEDNWSNSPGSGISANGVTHTRESKLQAWAKEMASYKQVAKTAAVEIARKSDELQAAKAQVARLKMELSLSAKGKEEVETKLVEVQQENALLKTQVAQSQLAMKSTLEEAIKLLAEEMEDDDEQDDDDHHDGGASTSSEMTTQRAGWASNWRSVAMAHGNGDDTPRSLGTQQRSPPASFGNWRSVFSTENTQSSNGTWRAMFS